MFDGMRKYTEEERRQKNAERYKKRNADPVLHQQELARKREYRQRKKELVAQAAELRKFEQNTRRTIRYSFQKLGLKMPIKTEEILGCSLAEFKEYIVSKWKPWMSWNNYGVLVAGESEKGWDCDHIIPVRTVITMEDAIRLNHYTNFQPLCSRLNRHIKRGSLDFTE